ncbi:hypothetical protein ACHAPJ_012486 [Fusarium lateritium]
MCSSSPSSVAQLNIWLLHCFNVIQLTRPFLIAHTRNIHTPPGSSLESRGEYAETKKLAEACIRAASQTITTIQAASAKDLISAKNPFTVAWTFMAALILFTDSFFKLSDDPDRCKLPQVAIELQKEFAKSDHRSKAFAQTLLSLQDALTAGIEHSDLQQQRDTVIERLVTAQGPPKPPSDSSVPLTSIEPLCMGSDQIESFLLDSSLDFGIPVDWPSAEWMVGDL